MKTRSVKPGASTLAVEVTNVSPFGIWLLFDERERFLPFRDFPWFEHATIKQIGHVLRPARHHLYWPDLDIDLATASIDAPNEFPLVSSLMNNRVSRARAPAAPNKKASPRRRKVGSR